MPTFTLRTNMAIDLESIQKLKDNHIIYALMTCIIPDAIQTGFSSTIGQLFGIDKITKQLDTSTILFDPKILVLVECYDHGIMSPDTRHDLEEAIAKGVHVRLKDELKAFYGDNGPWHGMPIIDVRLDPKSYSITAIDSKGNVFQRIPHRQTKQEV